MNRAVREMSVGKSAISLLCTVLEKVRGSMHGPDSENGGYMLCILCM